MTTFDTACEHAIDAFVDRVRAAVPLDVAYDQVWADVLTRAATEPVDHLDTHQARLDDGTEMTLRHDWAPTPRARLLAHTLGYRTQLRHLAPNIASVHGARGTSAATWTVNGASVLRSVHGGEATLTLPDGTTLRSVHDAISYGLPVLDADWVRIDVTEGRTVVHG